MTELFGERKGTSMTDEGVEHEFLISARSKSQAGRRASNNMRIQGERDFEIEETNVEEEREDSRRSVYSVVAVVPR